MKALELARALMEHPGREVILASDAEGNKNSPVGSVNTCAYIPDTDYSGETKMEPGDLTITARKGGFTEEDVVQGSYIAAIVLGPMV